MERSADLCAYRTKVITNFADITIVVLQSTDIHSLALDIP